MHSTSRTLRSRTFHSACALGAATLSCLVLTATAQAQTYTLTDLGTLGGSQSFATDVNNSGQVVGNSVTGDGSTHGFVSGVNGGPIKDLGTVVNSIDVYTGLPYTITGTDSYAVGINNKGQVAGNIPGSNNGLVGFISTLNGGTLKGLNIGDNPNLSVIDINDKGQIVGGTDVGTFFYDPNVGGDSYTSLQYFYGVAMNNNGQIAGNVSERPEGFLWDTNTGSANYVSSLGPGRYSPAFDINDRGQVVGSSENRDKFEEQHAYLTGPNGSGPSTDLGTLVKNVNPNNDYTFSQAHGLNNKDQVVGTSDAGTYGNGNYAEHAFIWANGVMTDLNSLIAPGGGLTLTDATAISDTGFIVGDATNAAGQTHAFLLTPVAVPEASTVVSFGLLLGLGIGAVVVRRRKAAQVKLV